MRGLAQALLLAPALVAAAPSRIAVQIASQSTFVTFDIPPGLDEDKPRPYTVRLDVLEASSPCDYPNVKVNDSPLSEGGRTLGRGTFAGAGDDGAALVASWTATCDGDEQLLRFALESLAGRALAPDLAFVARFRQTAPAAILEVTGDVLVSDRAPPSSQPLLLEDPPFPPPPHHHVGDHPDNHPDEPQPQPSPPDRPSPPGRRPMSPEEEEHVRVKLHELDCLRHQLHALTHAIHAKESHLAQEHGILPPPNRRAFRDCDSLSCVLETFVHRLRAGLRGEGRGRHHRHHDHPHPHPHHHHNHNHHHGGHDNDPPTSCPAFPFPGHGNGNHTLPPPPPPPPPGSCHCPPPPLKGPPEGHPPPPPFHEPRPGPPGHHDGPPPPFHEPHPGPPGHHGPPPPPPPHHPHPFNSFDWLFHGPPPPPGFPPHGPPPPPPPPPGFQGQGPSLPVKIATATLLLDEEKRAFLSAADACRPSVSSDEGRGDDDDDDDFETVESMTSEITQFRNAATLVTEMVAAEERRQRMREQQQQQQPPPPLCCSSPRREYPDAVAALPGPTAAFAEYVGDDDVLPAYDEHAPSVVVSDGFSSYSPGSSEYAPSASSDTASNIDSVLGDAKN
ncbi:hypothetical protein LX36DRAFT_685612 [Colletotrichum falcatum]|nr:hypothetical protein LX36DRAFT_685612 [Colletotrichum falcatum]